MKEIKTPTTECACVALGYFDCLHEGHRQILFQTCKLATEAHALCAMFTFYDEEFVSIKGPSVYTYDEKIQIAHKLGVDAVIPFVFDEKTRKMDKKSFLDAVFSLVQVQSVCCGFDYTFGYMGEGNVSYLQEYCQEKNVPCYVVDCVSAHGEKLAGSHIRQFLSQGLIEQANEQLYEPYFVQGTVVKGKGIGHTFGVPTANLSVPPYKMIPKEGVYATKTTVDGKTFRSVTNVGSKPTFDDQSLTIETLLADFEGNLYGKSLKVTFVRHLRDIQKFESAQQLKDQILNDLTWEE